VLGAFDVGLEGDVWKLPARYVNCRVTAFTPSQDLCCRLCSMAAYPLRYDTKLLARSGGLHHRGLEQHNGRRRTSLQTHLRRELSCNSTEAEKHTETSPSPPLQERNPVEGKGELGHYLR
jgi:hypothetical protein